MASGLQGFRASGLQGFRASGLQGFRASGGKLTFSKLSRLFTFATLVLALVAGMSMTALAADVVIGSVDDWNAFAESVNVGNNNHSGDTVKLTANVGVVTQNVTGTFSGTFDGGGHTLTVNLAGSDKFFALFQSVENAKIQNLTLAGSVTSSFANYAHTAALVGSIVSGCEISKVVVTASVFSAGTFFGGFIGHGSNS
nr:hypothetical protein [Fretibacterium sp.]